MRGSVMAREVRRLRSGPSDSDHGYTSMGWWLERCSRHDFDRYTQALVTINVPGCFPMMSAQRWMDRIRVETNPGIGGFAK